VLDLKKLENMEGRRELEAQLKPLGVEKYHITKALADINSDVYLADWLLHVEKMVVRAYMISGYDMAKRDVASESDPYLIIAVGDKVYNERDNYQLDARDPDFHKHYDFEAVFPGCP
jgi:hypothetical protein